MARSHNRLQISESTCSCCPSYPTKWLFWISAHSSVTWTWHLGFYLDSAPPPPPLFIHPVSKTLHFTFATYIKPISSLTFNWHPPCSYTHYLSPDQDRKDPNIIPSIPASLQSVHVWKLIISRYSADYVSSSFLPPQPDSNSEHCCSGVFNMAPVCHVRLISHQVSTQSRLLLMYSVPGRADLLLDLIFHKIFSHSNPVYKFSPSIYNPYWANCLPPHVCLLLFFCLTVIWLLFPPNLRAQGWLYFSFSCKQGGYVHAHLRNY